jgi:uncharacterized protein YbjT (DUF2867 family)
MTSTTRRDRAVARSLIAVGLASFVTGLALAIIAAAQAGSTPVGPLPAGPVSTITTTPSQLVAVALQRAAGQSGLVWRLARRYDSHIVSQVSEADVGANVVVVFKVVGRGNTSLVFALTRGDASPRAVKSATRKIRSM